MFDIAFSELLVIGVVALLVIGPERLPKVARTAGAWLGKLNRYAQQVKSDVDREMRLAELKKLQGEMQSTAQKYEIMAAEAEVKMQRELTVAERLALSVGVNDSPGAAEIKQALEAEDRLAAAGQPQGGDGALSGESDQRERGGSPTPHAVIEYAHPAIDARMAEDNLNEGLEDNQEDWQASDRVEDAPSVEKQASLF